MTISELRRRKFVALFHRLDVNANGVLERDDVLAMAEKFVARAGWAVDSAQARGMRKLFGVWWTVIAAAADANADGVITPDEWAIGAGSMDREAFVSTGEMVFDAFDRSGDGRISPAEYRAFLSLYGVDAGQADAIFARIDLDGDGHVTRAEFDSLFGDWGVSDDEDAPGNWLMGPY